MMQKKWLMGILARALLLVIAGGVWLFSGKSSPEEVLDEQGMILTELITKRPKQEAKKGSPVTRLFSTSTDKTAKSEGGTGGARDADDADGTSDDDDDDDTPDEKAVKHWEKTIAEFYEETEDADEGSDGNKGGSTAGAGTTAPNVQTQPKEPRVTLDDQLRIRDAFREMSEDSRMEEIHHTMNLLPDESIAVIYGVLFDKTQPEDIMDVIFSDILNRDESIKILMMREIAKDPTHPMYEESVRILEITDDDD